MIKVLRINNDFISCNTIKPNIPFNISEKLIDNPTSKIPCKNIVDTIIVQKYLNNFTNG